MVIRYWGRRQVTVERYRFMVYAAFGNSYQDRRGHGGSFEFWSRDI